MRLSLKSAEKSTGFQEFEILKDDADPAPGTLPSTSAEGKQAQFEFSNEYFEMLLHDASFKAEFDRMVSREVESRWVGEAARLRSELMTATREESLALGRAQAQKELSEVTGRLEIIGQAMLAEKATLLNSHVDQWCEAFSHLLKRFLVPGHTKISETLKSWLEESLENYAETKKVKIFLPEGEAEKLVNWASQLPHFEIASDLTLQLGELRCETEEGDIFFSPGPQLEKLDQKIAEWKAEMHSAPTPSLTEQPLPKAA